MITKAMVARLKQVEKGYGVTRFRRTGPYFSFGNPTWPWTMGAKLEDAGLIEFRLDDEGKERAYLTEAGRAAISA